MADKIFVGKVFQDQWQNNELSLSGEDLAKLQNNLKSDKVKVKIKKSLKGTWYAEIDTYQAP